MCPKYFEKFPIMFQNFPTIPKKINFQNVPKISNLENLPKNFENIVTGFRSYTTIIVALQITMKTSAIGS
jgi:hypothetical protein